MVTSPSLIDTQTVSTIAMKLDGPVIKSGPPGPKVTKVLETAGLGPEDYGSPLVERAEGIYIERARYIEDVIFKTYVAQDEVSAFFVEPI